MSQPLAPYPDYKPAGLPWLDKVPAHWGVFKVKHLFRERSEKGYPDEPLLAATQKQGVVLKTMVGSRTVEASKDFHLLKLVRVGDFVISLRSFEGGIEYAHYQGIISPAYNILTPIEPANALYLAYLLKAKPFVESLSLFVTGIREGQNIDNGKFSISFLPMPPLLEQQRIVAFLDAKGRQIARLLRHKRQLIKLLNEQKQALIHRAVTQGLDANAPHKDSGVTWLGKVPAHWEVRRIKYILREVDSRSTTGSEVLLSMRMHHGLVPYHEHFDRPQQSSNLIDYKLVKPGQLVINRMQAGNGVIFFSQLHGLVSPDYAVFDVINDANTTFLGEVFRNHATRKKFRSESKGLGTGTSGFLRLYTDRLGAIHLALPPRSEQDFIIDERDARLAKTNETISRAQREIELIQEYRTRLIADVVTGRVDVRHLSVTAVLNDVADLLDEETGEEESEEELLLETEDGRD